jgi:serine/threonine protein kinase/CheY-like chemotaxis protein
MRGEAALDAVEVTSQLAREDRMRGLHPLWWGIAPTHDHRADGCPPTSDCTHDQGEHETTHPDLLSIPLSSARFGFSTPSAPGTVDLPAMSKTRARLLVVDDSRSTRAALKGFLEKTGHEVVALASGEEALELLEEESFDLVLLDVVMRGMDGLEVLGKLRERFTKLELPVLMATARVDSLDVVKALELGANDYVTKPIDLPIAAARVESQLALRGELESVKRRRPIITADGAVALGTVLDGRYELLEIVGAGGFAVVYKARQVSTGQEVAVKLMKAHRAVSGDVELARFRREMSLIAELRHPHIVRLIDSGWLDVDTRAEVAPGDEIPAEVGEQTQTAQTISIRPDGEIPAPRDAEPTEVRGSPALETRARIPFIVMEFLSGESLHAHLRSLPEGETFSVERAVDIFLPIISALYEAHSRGAVHRDLKPANVFLARAHDGSLRPLVLDFGIAKLTDAANDEELTQDADDGIMGTPGWWAPEQARSNAVIDERTDEFQLGAIIYRCVTGHRPFEAKGPDLLREVAEGRFAPPSKHVDLPNGFEAVLLQIMATDPADRYPNMRSVARALLPFASKRAYAVWEPVFEPGDTIPPPG